jgi:DTW domain-containing protein YfiP
MLSPNSPFYCAHCIACRLPSASCVCEKIEQVELPFIINLCCHSNEWQRHDNTGQWAHLSSKDVHRIRWHRKPELIYPALSEAYINSDSYTHQAGHYLLFPSDDAVDLQHIFSDTSNDAEPIKALWIIDGTWQEAKKMLRQSPWLKTLPKVSIQATEGEPLESHFKLRKNQQGLCTFEAIQAAIKFQDPLTAQSLNNNFHLFQNTLLGLLR